jgi:hypothetical protein
MRYQFEQLQLDDSGIVHADGFADIETDGEDWWISAIFTEEEVGAVHAVWDYPKVDGAPIRPVIVAPRIPGKIVTKYMDKAEPFYTQIVHALHVHDDCYIRDKLFRWVETEDGVVNEHDTRNHNQQGI